MKETTSTQSLRDVASAALQIARQKGAQGAFAGVSRQRDVEVVWRDGKLDKISEATTRSLGLQIYVDGRYGAMSTSDLRPDALEKFIDDAVRLSRTLSRDPFRALPDPALYGGRAAVDLQIEDPRYDAVNPEERRRIARELEAACRAVPGSTAILSVTTSFSDSLSETLRMSSNGFEGAQRETEFWMNADVSVKDRDGRRPEEGYYAGARHFADLPTAAAVGAEAAGRAVRRLGSKKVASAVLPMAVQNRAAGRLASFLIGPLSAGNLQQKRSFLEGRQGQQIGSALLTVADDPLARRGLGSRLFDSEGLAARRLPVFEGGVLRSFYVDNYYGRKLKMAPTTGRPSNLAWVLGDRGEQALLAEMKDGILVSGFLGGNSNGTTGDFSLGVLGYRVRGGQISEPVGEMNISGNHLDLWQRLVAVGNDPFPSSTMRTPTLVFDKVQFAGT